MRTSGIFVIALLAHPSVAHAQSTPAVEAAECDSGGGGTSPFVNINELHYDNDGTDVGEFIELAGNPCDSLSGWQLILYNGTASQRSPYDTIVFETTDVLSNDGLFVIEFPSNGIQNGSPDGLALVDPSGDVIEFLSYEGSFEAASGPAAGLTSTDIGVAESASTPVGLSLQLIGGVWAGPIGETRGAINEDTTGIEFRTIMAIQGADQSSPEAGNVVETSGIVTAVGEFDAVGGSDEQGFYIQDATGDADIATSDAIFVVSGASATLGDAVTVQGLVEESGFPREATYTRIQASSVTVDSSGNDLPAPVLLGAGGRVPPSENIDDDALTAFEPETDGLDFFESLEAMRVTVQSPRVVNGTSRFGEIFVVVDGGASATGISNRQTLNISPDDFNPEKIQIDPGRESSDPQNTPLPLVDVGATLADVTGVVGYDFGNFQVQPDVQSGPVEVVTPATITPATSTLSGSDSALLVATYNVLNLDPNDDDGDTDLANDRFTAIADQIINNLNSPDIIGLQEVQDNTGSLDNGVVAADLTLQTLVDSIVDAGGPSYTFIDNTFIVNNNSGGQPGANIRTAFLYNTERVSLVPGSVRTVDNVSAFTGARLPIIATFDFEGEAVTVVNNHFSSKGGSAPIFGTEQPFEARQEDVAVNGSLDERLAQSAEVRNFVDGVLGADPEAKLVVLGDLNEFEFVSPVSVNLGEVLNNLTFRLAEDERYTFIFQGNSQSLDHILVSDSLVSLSEFEVVHANVEFAETASRASDHDPAVVQISFDLTPTCEGEAATVFVSNGRVVGGPLEGQPYNGVLVGTVGSDVIVGTDGKDLIAGGLGADLICAEAGRDLLIGGTGADRLFGGGGDDRLLGGRGRDQLDGGAGNDHCRGGLGRDDIVGCE
ncbi:MAG: endonuclease/exonuclease/phosphatase family protein [Myxococcota bacterium]